MRYAYKSLVDKSEGKRPPERSVRTWKGNIDAYLTKIICEISEWTELAYDSAR